MMMADRSPDRSPGSPWRGDRDRVVVDVASRTIDASAWLASISDWHRPAVTRIVAYWADVLASPLGGGRNVEYWVGQLYRSATLLTEATVGVRRLRGVAEVQGRPGICWVGDAAGGLGGTYLCWTSLFHGSLYGASWMRERSLVDVRPIGSAAEEIVAHVVYRIAVEGP